MHTWGKVNRNTLLYGIPTMYIEDKNDLQKIGSGQIIRKWRVWGIYYIVFNLSYLMVILYNLILNNGYF